LEKRQCDFVPAKLKIAAHIVHGSHLDGSRELDLDTSRTDRLPASPRKSAEKDSAWFAVALDAASE
jgi:hypothetical protein